MDFDKYKSIYNSTENSYPKLYPKSSKSLKNRKNSKTSKTQKLQKLKKLKNVCERFVSPRKS